MPFSGYEVVSVGEPIAPLHFIPGRPLALYKWSIGTLDWAKSWEVVRCHAPLTSCADRMTGLTGLTSGQRFHRVMAFVQVYTRWLHTDYLVFHLL
jgi:hypothetical protein